MRDLCTKRRNAETQKRKPFPQGRNAETQKRCVSQKRSEEQNLLAPTCRRRARETVANGRRNRSRLPRRALSPRVHRNLGTSLCGRWAGLWASQSSHSVMRFRCALGESARRGSQEQFRRPFATVTRPRRRLIWSSHGSGDCPTTTSYHVSSGMPKLPPAARTDA